MLCVQGEGCPEVLCVQGEGCPEVLCCVCRERVKKSTVWTRDQEEELATLYQTYKDEEGVYVCMHVEVTWCECFPCRCGWVLGSCFGGFRGHKNTEADSKAAGAAMSRVGQEGTQQEPIQEEGSQIT